MADGFADGGAMGELRSAMLGLVNDPKARPRERVAAARVVLSAARLVREFESLRAELARPAVAAVIPCGIPGCGCGRAAAAEGGPGGGGEGR